MNAPTNNTAEQHPCGVCGKPSVIVLGEMVEQGTGRLRCLRWDLSMPAYPRCAQHCGTSGLAIAKKAKGK